MPAFTEKVLGQGQIASASATTLYTAPGSTIGILKDLQIANTTATAATISVYIDPDGATADDTTAILKGFSIPANDFLHWSGFIPIAATGTIKAQGGTNNAITITASGAEIV